MDLAKPFLVFLNNNHVDTPAARERWIQFSGRVSALSARAYQKELRIPGCRLHPVP
jgi:hypothetical protein